jgi:hypothetical protein
MVTSIAPVFSLSDRSLPHRVPWGAKLSRKNSDSTPDHLRQRRPGQRDHPDRDGPGADRAGVRKRSAHTAFNTAYGINGTRKGMPTYNVYLDYYANGLINITDKQQFQSRVGLSV